MILFNSEKCDALSINYVNTASGLDLHRFNWLENDSEIGEIPSKWNHLVDVQSEGNLIMQRCCIGHLGALV